MSKRYSRLAGCFFLCALCAPNNHLFITKNKSMQKYTTYETVNSQAAGIDIGTEKIFVSADGITVISFRIIHGRLSALCEVLIPNYALKKSFP
jgi:hypothetical protein